MSIARFKLLILTALCFSTAFQSKASHIMGGEITYRWITANDYEVTLVLYGDCSGISIPSQTTIYGMSGTCQDTFNVILPQIDTAVYSPGCTANPSWCSGGTAFGYTKGIYRDTLTLPFNCDDWKFVYTDCCRNTAITNLDNASGTGIYLYATLDNLNVPFNNLPVFTAEPVIFLTTGQTYMLNNGVFDPDRDSVVISLAPALDGAGGNIISPTAITYSGTFTYLDPVSSVPTLTLDPQTGTMTVSPTMIEVDVVVFKVEEYRNGILIGSTTRDIQIIIDAGSNQVPTLSGIIGQGTYVTNVCFDDTLQFSFMGLDTNPGDTLTYSWYTFTGSNAGGSNYTFNSSGVNPNVATFTFIPDSSMISPNPYYLFVTIKDNACPYFGFQTYCYIIYVNSCSQDVWPGDANSDLQVNLYDILPIGLAYNNTGPIRTGASIAWIAQPATDWTNSFISGVNHKHADTNGDGTVDNADTNAISVNFGFSHPAKFINPEMTLTTVNDFYLEAGPDTAMANSTVNVKICLGTSSVPTDSIYGIAFRINFDPMLVDTSSGIFDYTGSWLGTQSTDLLTYDRKQMSSGFAEAAMVRTDHNNVSGDSIIAVFSIVIVDNIAGKLNLPFYLSDVYAITYNEAVLNFNLLGDTVVVSNVTGMNDVLISEISMYPVPATTYLHIIAGHEKIEQVILSDLSGRKLIVQNKTHVPETSLDLSHVAKGTYLVSVKTLNGTINKRITVTGK